LRKLSDILKTFILLILAIIAPTILSCKPQSNVLRRQLLTLHKSAARCGDEDTACVDRIFNRISSVRKQLTVARRGRCSSTIVAAARRTNCKRGSFDVFMTRRRDRISNMARKCPDEDDACITTAMNLLIALNSDISRQKKIWRKSCPRKTPVVSQPVVTTTTLAADAWVHRRIWTHEFTCDRLRSGFSQWLNFQKSRRKQVHDESCKCAANDLPCLRMNYQVIIRIQRTIRRNRNLFADRMSTCDECAPIKLKWYRWLVRQRARRHRLQLEACRCPEDDTDCMQRRVNRIKAIQTRISQRRTQVLNLHGNCVIVRTTKASGTPAPVDELADL